MPQAGGLGWTAGFTENRELGAALEFLRFSNPSTTERAAAHARRRLAHAIQQFLQHDRVVVLLVSRGIQQRDLGLAFHEIVQLLHGSVTLFTYQLVKISFPEHAPPLAIRMEPLSQLV